MDKPTNMEYRDSEKLREEQEIEKNDHVSATTTITGKNEDDDVKTMFQRQCVHCKKEFSTQSSLKRHLQTTKKCISNRETVLTSDSISSSIQGEESHNRIFKCSVCKTYETPLKHNLKMHEMQCEKKHRVCLDKIDSLKGRASQLTQNIKEVSENTQDAIQELDDWMKQCVALEAQLKTLQDRHQKLNAKYQVEIAKRDVQIETLKEEFHVSYSPSHWDIDVVEDTLVEVIEQIRLRRSFGKRYFFRLYIQSMHNDDIYVCRCECIDGGDVRIERDVNGLEIETKYVEMENFNLDVIRKFTPGRITSFSIR